MSDAGNDHAPATPSPGWELASLLDLPRLVSLGWDPEHQSWRLDDPNSALRHRQCAIAGCRYEASSRRGLCSGCLRRWRAAATPFDEFVGRPMDRNRWHDERLCTVCRTPGHCRPALVDGLCAACNGLRRSRNQTVAALIAGDDRFPPVRPRPTIGSCAVASCERLAAFRLGLCHRHYKRWAEAGRPDLGAWSSTTEAMRGGSATAISLAGVSARIQAEVLFGVQTAVDQGATLRASDIRRVLEHAQRGNHACFEDLLAATADGPWRRFVARTVAAIDRATLSPEIEVDKDVWDLRAWGCTGRLSFAGPRWLRDASKRWAASRLPIRSAPYVKSVVAAVGRWSDTLDGRNDGGSRPDALSHEDIERFLAALHDRAHQGLLRSYTHRRTVLLLRRFLIDCRQMGLLDLSPFVTVTRDDLRQLDVHRRYYLKAG